MGYSASTRNRPPDAPIALFLLLAGEDHPKACTGRRLLHRRLATAYRPPGRGRAPALVLDPHSERPLSLADLEHARAGGLLAIDCSWNRIRDRGSLPPGADPRGHHVHRRLPLLVAANPQHFGRLAELNTAEALAAALAVLGHGAEAARLLEAFPGGPNLLAINRDRIARYAAAESASEIVVAERALFGPPAPASAPRGRSSSPRSRGG